MYYSQEEILVWILHVMEWSHFDAQCTFGSMQEESLVWVEP